MDILFNNPLANMPGTTFLLFYLGAVITAFLILGFSRIYFDWTSKLPVPPIPEPLDSLEIAFLRGGENELARSVVFSLNQKGFLNIYEAGNKSFIVQKPTQADWTTLSSIEKSTLPYFQTPRETKEVFYADGLKSYLQSFSTIYEQKLYRQNLLLPENIKISLQLTKTVTIGLLFLLGAYKLMAAFMHNRGNVFFLIMMIVFAVLIGIKAFKIPRISRLGKEYLKSLQNTFEKYKKVSVLTPSQPVFGAVDPTLMAVGLFGMSALSASLYPEYQKAFKASSSTSGSSCGSSCGSSGGDGGGDGGGCGGGGCGGCG